MWRCYRADSCSWRNNKFMLCLSWVSSPKLHIFILTILLQSVMHKGRYSTANPGTNIAVLLGMHRYGSFPLLSVPRSLFSIWTDLKRSENIPEAPAWKWGKWIWLTGLSGLHRNSRQGLNISSVSVFDQIKSRKSQSLFVTLVYKFIYQLVIW